MGCGRRSGIRFQCVDRRSDRRDGGANVGGQQTGRHLFRASTRLIVENERRAPRLDAESRAKLEEMRSEEHTSELQSLMRISYAGFCLNKKKIKEAINPKLAEHINTHQY